MMNGFGTGMGFGGGIGMLLGLVVAVLAIAALIKYLRTYEPLVQDARPTSNPMGLMVVPSICYVFAPLDSPY